MVGFQAFFSQEKFCLFWLRFGFVREVSPRPWSHSEAPGSLLDAVGQGPLPTGALGWACGGSSSSSGSRMGPRQGGLGLGWAHGPSALPSARPALAHPPQREAGGIPGGQE